MNDGDGRPRPRPASWWTQAPARPCDERRAAATVDLPSSHPTSVSTGLQGRGTVCSGLLGANVASGVPAAAAKPPAAAEQESGVLRSRSRTA